MMEWGATGLVRASFQTFEPWLFCQHEEEREKTMSHQFDELSKVLSSGRSRREALKLIGSAVAAAVLGWRKPANVSASHQPSPRECEEYCRAAGFANGREKGDCMRWCTYLFVVNEIFIEHQPPGQT